MSIISTINQTISKSQPGQFTAYNKQIAGQLNKIACRATKSDKVLYTLSKATSSDFQRLTSKSIKDSYKRVTWVNPKDNKVYHILEEGRKDGKVQVRILGQDGEFIKNAELEPKNIVIFDNFYSPRGVTHGEMMEVFVKRFNPFANVERLEHKRGLYEIIKYRGYLPLNLETKRFKELSEQMDNGKKVDYISVSEYSAVNINEVVDRPGTEQKKYVEGSIFLHSIRPLFEKIISKGTRILMCAGNDNLHAKRVVNDRLSIDGVEGVGSLVNGKIGWDSCSRNSVFTQHYEQRSFRAKAVYDDNDRIIGINVTGLRGVDMPLTRKTKKLIDKNVGGTSYSTPIRVAKLSLNDMMEGIV